MHRYRTGNRRCSYVATAMSCARRLQHLPGQCN
ncbi:DUF4060 family protein [Klebsiella aerogenes]|nr:DUF4060 family protein [Klebsiella aerogenes]